MGVRIPSRSFFYLLNVIKDDNKGLKIIKEFIISIYKFFKINKNEKKIDEDDILPNGKRLVAFSSFLCAGIALTSLILLFLLFTINYEPTTIIAGA